MSEEDINYSKALEKSRNYRSEPEGLSKYIPSSQTDKILLKQNNTIIELLLDLHKKIDILIKCIETQKPLFLKCFLYNLYTLLSNIFCI